MTIKTGSAWAGLFVTLDATGALATPGTGPAGVLYVDGVANGASVTISGSNPYKWAVTLPSLTAGQRVDMYITATISSIATAAVVASEQVDTVILSDGVTVASIANNAITAAAIAQYAIDADSIKNDVVTKIQNGLATPTNITAGTITTVTSVTNGVTLANDAIKAATFDESTAFPLKFEDANLTKVARTGGDSDTLETLSDQIDTVTAKTNLITTGTTITIASPVSGSTITATRGDTLSAALENIGALTNYSKLWFTVKSDQDDADTASIVQIELAGGLLYINGAAATTAANGSITINDEATGDVTILLKAPETAKLATGHYSYDIQILRTTGILVSTLTSGSFDVSADYTRATA